VTAALTHLLQTSHLVPTLPVARHGPILGLGRSFRSVDHVRNPVLVHIGIVLASPGPQPATDLASSTWHVNSAATGRNHLLLARA
jgi:hypothetical protein